MQNLVVSFLGALAVCGSLVIAQTTGEQPVTTMSVKVKVVNVLATVRDKHGEVVGNLNKDDFTLAEDGRPQSIHYFAQESDLPLTLGLLVDTSLSQRRVIEQERSASHSFLDRMLREDRDQAFIIHFDHEVELLQDLTSSHEKLEAALDNLETPRLERASNPDPSSDPSPDPGGGGGHRGGRGGGGGGFHGGGTMLYDAVYLASDELMKKQQGRKAVIILSDGVDTGSKETLQYAMETAQRSDTVVYSILFRDDEQGGGGFGGPTMGGSIGGLGGGMGRRGGRGGYPQQRPRVDGKKILEQISRETGGRLFEVSKKEPLEQIYAQIEDELRHEYSLGYTPDRASAAESGYHKIQVAVKKKDLVVQTREGYYGEH